MTAVAVAVYTLQPVGQQASGHVDPVTSEMCIEATVTPYDPASGQAMHAAKSIPVEARCPVCGMYPARTPRWAAQIVFRDGASHFFDSPIDLFVVLQGTDRTNLHLAQEDIAVSYVTDFETRHWIEAQHAFFVQGSAIPGPMRNADLPAFSTRESALVFVRNQGGKVLAFNQVGPEVVRSMSRNTHHRH